MIHLEVRLTSGRHETPHQASETTTIGTNPGVVTKLYISSKSIVPLHAEDHNERSVTTATLPKP
jgi:hypothetical protein